MSSCPVHADNGSQKALAAAGDSALSVPHPDRSAAPGSDELSLDSCFSEGCDGAKARPATPTTDVPESDSEVTGSEVASSEASSSSAVQPPDDAECRQLEVRHQQWAQMSGGRGGIRAFATDNPDTFSRRVHRGIPAEYRWEVWRTSLRVDERSSPGMYQALLKAADRSAGEGQEDQEPWLNQIDLDTPRTFPRLASFGQEQEHSLHRILRAYAALYPDVGYCQGMNFIAGILLIVSQDEEGAFWAFVSMMDEGRISGFYIAGFPLLQRYMAAFEAFAAEAEPELWQHLVAHDVNPGMFLHRWYLTLFANSLPLPMVIPFWDIIICSGLDALLPLGVTLLRSMKWMILRQKGVDEIAPTLKTICAGQEEKEAASRARAMVTQCSRISVPSHIRRLLSDDGDSQKGVAHDLKSGLAVAAEAFSCVGSDLKQGFKEFKQDLQQGKDMPVTDAVLNWWEETRSSRAGWWEKAKVGLVRRDSASDEKVGQRRRTVPAPPAAPAP